MRIENLKIAPEINKVGARILIAFYFVFEILFTVGFALVLYRASIMFVMPTHTNRLIFY